MNLQVVYLFSNHIDLYIDFYIEGMHYHAIGRNDITFIYTARAGNVERESGCGDGEAASLLPDAGTRSRVVRSHRKNLLRRTGLAPLCENATTLSRAWSNVMDRPGTTLTSPILSPTAELWFSAYGFGWGYCSFALPAETICEKLGAANDTSRQLMLAFELGKVRLLQAIEEKSLPATGERIELSAADL